MNDDGAKSIQIMGLCFFQVQLFFEPGSKTNLFAMKNNKTLDETICAPRYCSLATMIKARYPDSIHKPLGIFLLERKQAGDRVYKLFLNSYGDEIYSRFFIRDTSWLHRKGLYCYMLGESIMYIGQTKDSFGKRINQGYGNIAPKNCYLDGQAVNCHVNSLITDHPNDVELYLCELRDPSAIDRMEKKMIQEYQPSWNIALKGR